MQDLVRFGYNVPVTSVCDSSKLCTQLDVRRVQPSDPTVGNKHRIVVQHCGGFVQGIDGEAH